MGSGVTLVLIMGPLGARAEPTCLCQAARLAFSHLEQLVPTSSNPEVMCLDVCGLLVEGDIFAIGRKI